MSILCPNCDSEHDNGEIAQTFVLCSRECLLEWAGFIVHPEPNPRRGRRKVNGERRHKLTRGTTRQNINDVRLAGNEWEFYGNRLTLCKRCA